MPLPVRLALKQRVGMYQVARTMPADQQTDITTFTQSDDEWWTPTWLIEASRGVLGEITLDPASTPLANERIRAKYICTREDNGLEKTWWGNVFLNPPSKRGDPTARPHLWAQKLAHDYELGHVSHAILIVKSVLGYKWYENLYLKYWVCHLRERPSFVRPDGSTVGPCKKGVSVFYMGDSKGIAQFKRKFGHYGRLIEPCVISIWVAL